MNPAITVISSTLILLAASSVQPQNASAASTARLSSAHALGKHSSRYQIHHVRSAVFPVIAFGGARVDGSVSVSSQGSQTHLTVSVGGLAPFSTHAIHVHAGSCRNPYGGLHIYVLGFPQAGSVGRLTLPGPGPIPYVAGSDYVIVYANTAPSLIIGCASLGALR